MLGCCSKSLQFSLSAGIRIEYDFRGSEGYRRFASEAFGVVGLLEFGVIGLLAFGDFGLFEIEPERKSGNRCGDTVRLS